MFVVGHHEVLMHFRIYGENSRSECGVSSDVTELPERRFSERCVVPPSGRTLVRCGNALASHVVRPVISGLGIGVVNATDAEGRRYPALSCYDSTDLPAADDRVGETIVDVQ